MTSRMTWRTVRVAIIRRLLVLALQAPEFVTAGRGWIDGEDLRAAPSRMLPETPDSLMLAHWRTRLRKSRSALFASSWSQV